MYLLFPGRHHLMTEFQFKYLLSILHNNENITDDSGEPVPVDTGFNQLIFAVTSANHSNTKRNPLAFHQRAIMLQEFSRDLAMKSLIYGINDVGYLEDFANYTIQSIKHQSDGKIDLSPANCVVICSTAVRHLYKNSGFKILPAELIPNSNDEFHTPHPWYYVTKIAESVNWNTDIELLKNIHSSTINLWNNYQLGSKVKKLLLDPIVGEDGDITESRDYNAYVRQMDEIAEIKYKETAPFIKCGNIGDIGCAVGSWIKLAASDPKLSEATFYGIELTRQLHDICEQRKSNNEFKNPYVFFAMKNAVTGLVFSKSSMHTIHCSSLTHEIESYGGRGDLLNFIANRYEELNPGGVWINRDVIGPQNGEQQLFMKLNDKDGSNDNVYKEFESNEALKKHIDQLSTFSTFLRFARDFRREEEDGIVFEVIDNKEGNVISLKFRDAADFMLTKDYTDNWYSEMHERFCFWSISDWEVALKKAGFRIGSASHDYQNPWIVENRWRGKVALFADQEMLKKVDFPPTNALIVAEKI